MSTELIKITALTKTEAETLAALISEELFFSVDAVALDEITEAEWSVSVYVSASPPDEALKETFALINGSSDWHATREPIAEMDWIAEGLRDLKPVSAGRFLVHGSHDTPAVSAGTIGIQIDAGQAFGTGHHGTTAGCLMALSRLEYGNQRPDRILDVGTGSGVLAIAAAKLFKRPVFATDMDETSVGITRENAQLNGVSPWIRAIVSSRVSNLEISMMGPFGLIFANILARPLTGLAPQIARQAGEGCTLILSGLLHHQAEPVRRAYESRGFVCRDRIRLGEWTTLILSKP